MGPNQILDKGMVAETAIPLYSAVVQTGVEHCSLTTTANEQAVGICQEEVDTDEVGLNRVVRVRVHGISRAIAGAAIAERDVLAVNADGTVSPAAAPAAPAAGATTTVNHIGIATTGGAAGEWVDVLLTPGAKAQRFG